MESITVKFPNHLKYVNANLLSSDISDNLKITILSIVESKLSVANENKAFIRTDNFHLAPISTQRSIHTISSFAPRNRAELLLSRKPEKTPKELIADRIGTYQLLESIEHFFWRPFQISFALCALNISILVLQALGIISTSANLSLSLCFLTIAFYATSRFFSNTKHSSLERTVNKYIMPHFTRLDAGKGFRLGKE